MSRVGNKPVAIPSNVTVMVGADNVVSVKGAKGELTAPMPAEIKIEVKENEIVFSRPNEDKQTKANHGLTRALVNNMVTGVDKGFEKRLQIIGVGYRAQASGKSVKMQLGFSHDVEMQAPEGIEVNNDTEDKQVLIVTGTDRQKVGQFAAEIRKWRKPEPYKGKGIRYVDEYVPRKAGKAAAK